ELAEAAGGRPVYLSRVDGHQGLATLDVLGDSGALEAPGCDRDPGGVPPGRPPWPGRPAAGWPACTRWVVPTSPAGATSSCCWTGSRPCPSRWSATGATWTSSTLPTASWPRPAVTCSWTGRSAPTPPPSPPPTTTGPTPPGCCTTTTRS